MDQNEKARIRQHRYRSKPENKSKMKARSNAWYAKNKWQEPRTKLTDDEIRERRREYDRKWREKNRERILERERERYQENIERERSRKRRNYHSQAKKEWRETYRTKQNKQTRDWQKRNPNQARLNIRKASSKRRAALLKRTPQWLTEEDWDAINFFYECCPAGCHVDHIIPLQGELVSGLHVPENLQWLSSMENTSKNNTYVP